MDGSDFDDFKPVVISVVIILNITLNVLVIAVIVKYPQLREDRTTLFMFSLTLSDLANGCTSMPISAAVCSSATPNVRNTSRYLPKIQAVLLTWFVVNSLQSLCWMTVCKMVAITKPFRYEQLLSQRRCYFIIGVIWVTGAATGALFTTFPVTWNLEDCFCLVDQSGNSTISIGLIFFVFVVTILCPVIAMLYSTTRIFFVILRTHRQITAQVNSIGGENGNLATTPSLTLKSIRSGRNVLILCLALVILTIPFAVYAVMAMFELDYMLPSKYKFVVSWIFFCNSSANSLIYVTCFQSFREKTAHMIRGFCQLCTSR